MSGKEKIEIRTPLSKNILKKLRTGDQVEICGTIYTARDAAHKRMYDTIEQGGQLPFNPAGQVLFYVGPTPAPPGKVIGSARQDRRPPAAWMPLRPCSSSGV